MANSDDVGRVAYQLEKMRDDGLSVYVSDNDGSLGNIQVELENISGYLSRIATALEKIANK